jgi:hypothetical protein
MAITNLPYDDDTIFQGVQAVPSISQEVRDIHVDFTSTSTGPTDTARVTAVVTWTVAATDAVRILDDARPSTQPRSVPAPDGESQAP